MPPRHPFFRRAAALAPALFLVTALSAFGAERSLLLLHTNDIHDHVRPGADGVGGLAHLSGYVAGLRAERGDVLLLDAGDVTEKGDLVAFVSQSRVTWEALAALRYDATTIGNHDFSHGLDHIKECDSLAGGGLVVCANLHEKLFPPSKIVEVNGMKVGVIGMTVPRENNSQVMGQKDGEEAVAAEAARLRPDCDLLVLTAHAGTKDCAALARKIPDINVFVAGHTHELLQQPMTVPETGALVVSAGSNARWVGRVELAVDTEKKTARLVGGEVVTLSHDAVPCDKPLLDRILAAERELCPEAARVVARSDRTLTVQEVARLAVAGMREKSGADIAFCNTNQIMRNPLPAGEVTVNALFLTGGQRGHRLLRVSLTGAQVAAYTAGLFREKKGLSEAAGVAAFRPGDTEAEWMERNGLQPGRAYAVVMPEMEWETRFLKVCGKQLAAEGGVPAVEPCGFSFTDALTEHVEALVRNGGTLDAHAKLPSRRAKEAA